MNRAFSPFGALAVALAISLLLTGCALGTRSETPQQPIPPTPVSGDSETSATPASGENAPAATGPATSERNTATPAPGETSEPAATTPPETPIAQATTGSASEIDPNDYLDNRSNARALMQSFVNALNTKQYLRAYSYWNAERAQDLAPFPEFEAGYAGTEAVKLETGNVSGSAGAGSFKFTVPVIMEARRTEGDNQIFVGCYLLHLSNPGAQGTPPFEPLGIESAYVVEVDAAEERAARMEGICGEAGYPAGLTMPPAATPDAKDISGQVYIDDRSDPVDVLRSLFNAVNSGQLVRAYSYWEPDSEGLLPFDEFEAGYANTESVEILTGEVTTDPGAGQLFYSVPVTLLAQNRDGTGETFVGCYVLHLSQPAIQATPPFRPLAIRSAIVEPVPADADTDALMAAACQP